MKILPQLLKKNYFDTVSEAADIINLNLRIRLQEYSPFQMVSINDSIDVRSEVSL